MKAARAKPTASSSELQLFIRIKHPSLAPAEISKMLDMEPEEAVAAGPCESSTGVRRLHSETYWIARLPTKSLAELVQGFRKGMIDLSTTPSLTKEEVMEMTSASIHNGPISAALRRFDSVQDFFTRINREGGSVTLIVDRGEQPIFLKHALKKLAAFGIALELD
jgi:hypothetical protein